jgi:protein O-GlcNAc transferase
MENLHSTWMHRGTTLHAEGQPERALMAFENALELAPSDLNTVSACATLLTALARPVAAYNTLRSVEALLLGDADGAANLAIAAESCGDLTRARSAYQRALALNPQHVRSLNNVGLLAAAQSQWELAIECARQCLELGPNEAKHHTNLADFLTGSRRYQEALEVIAAGRKRFPDNLGMTARVIAVLAFSGDLEKSASIADTLDAAGKAGLHEFLERLMQADDADNKLRPSPTTQPDALQLYTSQAFDAMAVCDWSAYDQLAATLRSSVAQAVRTGQRRDWRDAQFYCLMLGLHEDELAQMRNVSTATIAANMAAKTQTSLPAFVQKQLTAKRNDGRIHVGLAVKSLRDPHYVKALKRQLEQHDASRFAIHVYSPTRQPMAYQADPLRTCAASVVETAHMTHVEAAGRIRLDQLDVFVDTAFDSAWCRPEILALRVAPVQIRQLTWHRHNPPQPCDYNLSDTFVHPDGLDLAPYGSVARLPCTCWLASDGSEASANRPTRASAGLPEGALVLCATVHAVAIDPQTFGLWMKILRSLPDAVLWLPAYGLGTSANLVREAQAVGVAADRLLFAMPMPREETLACTQHADLFLTPLRFNAIEGMVDALRMGVPAISHAGNGMASRMGGSVLRAADMADCISESPQAYVAQALHLGHNPKALSALRQRLQSTKTTVPLFDLPSRVRELEAAWTVMAERSRAGLQPVAFDVPHYISLAAAIK